MRILQILADLFKILLKSVQLDCGMCDASIPVQYLSEECSVESMREFKAALEEREKVRLQLIGDLTRKRESCATISRPQHACACMQRKMC